MLPWGLRSPLTSALAGRGAIQILVTKQLMNLESVQLNSTSVITCNHLVTLLYRGRRGETDPVRNFWFYDTINEYCVTGAQFLFYCPQSHIALGCTILNSTLLGEERFLINYFLPNAPSCPDMGARWNTAIHFWI